MALCIECSPAVQELRGSIPDCDALIASSSGPSLLSSRCSPTLYAEDVRGPGQAPTVLLSLSWISFVQTPCTHLLRQYSRSSSGIQCSVNGNKDVFFSRYRKLELKKFTRTFFSEHSKDKNKGPGFTIGGFLSRASPAFYPKNLPDFSCTGSIFCSQIFRVFPLVALPDIFSAALSLLNLLEVV